MKIALILIILIAVTALVISGCSHWQRSPEKRAEHFTEMITKKLKLNEEQKTKLETVKTELLTIRGNLKRQHEDKHKAIRELLSQSTLDQEKAQSAVNEQIQAFSSHTPQVIEVVANFWDSLDADQQAKLRDKMEQHATNECHWGGGCRHTW